MLIRAIRNEEKEFYNRVVNHPLQTWEWGEFRRQTGVKVERLGFFEGEQLVKGLQVTFHPLPVINKTVGYLPKAFTPDTNQLSALRQLAKKHQALFVKLEPNTALPAKTNDPHQNIRQFLLDHDAKPGRPLFTKHSIYLDLTKPEDELFAQLKKKTRYNVNLAYKKGVKIYENTSKEGIKQYLDILEETIARQGFYAHGPEYFQQMWDNLGQSGMMRIFNAVYQDQILSSWIMFIFNDVLYYPYGASRDIHRDVMPNNLLLWEMIRFGKEQGCHTFDLWGSLGPKPDKDNPYYGFHRFKEGYGGTIMEFVGSYDLVMNQTPYKLFRLVEEARWKWLRLKARLPF